MNLGNSPSLAPQYMAMIPAEKLSEIQTKYLEDLGKLGKDPNALEFKDRRFMGEAWQNPWSKALVSTYLLNSRYLNELVQAVQTDNKTRQRIEFATNQMIDALSPSNFLATNPEAPKEKAVNSYVLDGNAPNIKSLLALFQLHNITYSTYQGKENLEFKGFDYFNPTNQKIRIKQNDIVVSNRQEKGCLVDVLLEPSTKLSDSLTYDITAWSLPYAYGVPCGRIQKEVGPFESQAPVEKVESVPTAEPYAMVLPWTNLNSVKTLNYLLDSGYSVSRTEKDINTENHLIKAGSLVLLKSDNKEKSLLRAFQELEKKFQTTCLALSTGWNPNGLELGTSYIKPIMKPRVGVLFNHECSSLSLGEIWYFLDAELGIDHQLIRESSEGGISLWNNDIILLDSNFLISGIEIIETFEF